MKKLLIIIVISLSFQTNWAQQDLNNYKYIIVPKHFDFQTSADSYKINSLTKFLLDKKRFTTIFDDEVYPEDLIKNQCLALKFNLSLESNFTRTRIELSFINCKNEIVYKGEMGTSKLKDYKKSYHEAIRNSFKGLENFSYNYTPKNTEVVQVVKKKQAKLKVIKEVKAKTKAIVKVTPNKKIEKPLEDKAPKEKKIAQTQIIKTKKQSTPLKNILITGLYKYNNATYEISAFQSYYIFTKIESSEKSAPLGFIFKTSRKGNYLVKTTDTFTGYLNDKGDFIIDEIADDGTVKTKIFIKTEN